jgi:hypothetical protein
MLRRSRYGLSAAILHLILLGYTVAVIVAEAGSAWTRHWIIFLALDFPVSLGVLPVNWLAPPSAGGPFRDATNFWWPLLYHGVVGTGWWYIVGWGIERKVWRRPTVRDHGQKQQD